MHARWGGTIDHAAPIDGIVPHHKAVSVATAALLSKFYATLLPRCNILAAM
jgi:hypothetical protein